MQSVIINDESFVYNIHVFDYNFAVNDNDEELVAIFREALTRRETTSLEIVSSSANI